jgi:hypothetical protein
MMCGEWNGSSDGNCISDRNDDGDGGKRNGLY